MKPSHDPAALQELARGSGASLRVQLSGSIVWDNHACIPLRPEDVCFLPMLERVRDAGVDVISLNLAFGDHGAAQAFAMAQSITDWLESRPQHFKLLSSIDDLASTRAQGQLAVVFDLEGANALDGDIENVRRFYDIGVRWMLPTYNVANAAGGGCLEEDDGLTSFGRSVIDAMNDVGMVVCASHTGYRTARDVIDYSKKPVIFSHSNPRACHDHPRNIPDELMHSCAARDGVIGLCGFGPFLGKSKNIIQAYVDHILYALNLVGEDSIGIALDYVFDPSELDAYVKASPSMFPPVLYGGGVSMIAPWDLDHICGTLAKGGCNQRTLQKIFGENHRRVAQRCWR